MERLEKITAIAQLQLYDEPVYELKGICAHKYILKKSD